MALVSEDGTGKANAEAYNTVASFKAYCDGRGISYSGKSDTDIEQAARRAASFMLGAYRRRWAGNRFTNTQALDFPRAWVPKRDGPVRAYYPNNVVPNEVLWAEAELISRALTGDLNPDLTRAIVSESVGPISTTYDTASPEGPRYPAVEDLLRSLFVGGGGMRITRG